MPTLADVVAALEELYPPALAEPWHLSYPQLIEAGLLDELTLMILPVVLGQGKRLFGDGTPPRTLKMTAHKVSDGGSIVVTYEPAGPVEIGTYVMTPPSEREKARQAAMAEGSW